MPYTPNIIGAGSPNYPQPPKIKDDSVHYPQIWALGNLEILNKNLLGFYIEKPQFFNKSEPVTTAFTSLRKAGNRLYFLL